MSPNFLTFSQESTPGNQFRQSLYSLAGRYDNPISEKFPKRAMELQTEDSYLGFFNFSKTIKTIEDSSICELQSNVLKNDQLRALACGLKAPANAGCIKDFLHIVENCEFWIQGWRLPHM
jgi:hypothetical protein